MEYVNGTSGRSKKCKQNKVRGGGSEDSLVQVASHLMNGKVEELEHKEIVSSSES